MEHSSSQRLPPSKQVIFLSGLPRAGTTLVNSIVSQNKQIYCEGNTPLLSLMYGLDSTCKTIARELLIRNDKEYLQHELLNMIRDHYYKDVSQPVVLSMNKAWTQPYHLALLPYFTNEPRILVMVRPISEVVASLLRIRKNNKIILPEKNILDGEPIGPAIEGLAHVLKSNSNIFKFGTYDQLITNPHSFLRQACEFWQIENRAWDLDKIQNPSVENEQVFKTVGLHDIRPTIAKRTYHVEMTKSLQSAVRELDDALWHDYEQAKKLRPESFID